MTALSIVFSVLSALVGLGTAGFAMLVIARLFTRG